LEITLTGSFRVLVVHVGQDDEADVGVSRLILLRVDSNGSAERVTSASDRSQRRLSAVCSDGHGVLNRSVAYAPVQSASTHPPTVVIVNDDREQLDALTAHFSRMGEAVIGTARIADALALPPELQPQLLVFDENPADSQSWELTTRLRVRYPRCPIAVTSVLDVREAQFPNEMPQDSVTGRSAIRSRHLLPREASH